MKKYFNKDAIVSISIYDESNAEPLEIHLKGTWKKKPRLFSKGEKWEENVYRLWEYMYLHRESTLCNKYQKFAIRDGKLIYLSNIKIYFSDGSNETLIFNSEKDRDTYLRNFDLFKYIEVDRSWSKY